MTTTIVLDPDGRVIACHGPRLSAWRVIGRDFVRELGWTVGAEAAARIRAFAGEAERFRARNEVHGRRHDLTVALRRRGTATVISVRGT
jgi:hypothetical protein